MKNLINDVKENGLPYLQEGQAADANDLFSKIVKQQFTNKDAIKATHKALMSYINNDKAVYVLRLFGSDSKRNYNNLRRGFLTVYPDGKSIVFCDNTFAMPFAALKLGGKSYTEGELLKYMMDSSTRFGFGQTREEKELAYHIWKNAASVNLNTYGWYLAHIIPVGKNYSGKTLRDLFDNPLRSEWKDSIDKIRRPEVNLTEEELAMLKSHFLRMVHPLNSFLVPKRSMVAYNGKNIGEEEELINMVSDYIQTEFPKEYRELANAMQVPAAEPIYKTIGQVFWGGTATRIKRMRSKIKVDSTKSYLNEKNASKDIYDQNEEDILENTLKSIGKSAFLRLYPLVKANPDITITEVCDNYPEYRKYSSNSQKSRLSNARGIINHGQDYEALSSIIASHRLGEEDKNKAHRFLSDLE